MTSFIYNKSDPYEKNFQRWWKAKKLISEIKEYSSYATDSEEQARKLFAHYFEHKKVKVKRVKKLSN
jgi:hypothetical protein